MVTLSKYDVLNNKMNKFSKIIKSFIGTYALAFTKNKKYEVIKSLIEKVLCDAHILFEINKDLTNYLAVNNSDISAVEFSKILNQTSKQLEKVLLLYVICKNKSDDFIYKIIMDFISKSKTEDEINSYLYSNLDENDNEVLKFANSDDYDFYKLPQKYQELIIQNHNDYMNKNINLYVNKEESNKIEILKAIKIYNENVDVNLSVNLDIKDKVKNLVL